MTKYHAKPTVVQGIRFASKAEAKRYQDLRLLEKAGEISDLKLQVRYPLHTVNANGDRVKVCDYISDFVYVEDGVAVTEDVKGMVTQVYAIKRKWLLLEYGITIRET